MEKFWFLLALAYVATLAFISKIIHNRRNLSRKLPPGPKPWPIIGNLHLVGSIPHQSLHYLSLKYGELMLLSFGKFPVVVASSPEMAKQFLKVHDTVFASRPLLAAGKYTSYNHSDMTWSPYGPFWRQARRIYLSEMFSPKKLDFFAQLRTQESQRFFSRLSSLSGSVVLRDHLQRLTLSIIGSMLYREKKVFITSEEEGQLLELLEEWFLLGGALAIGDWIPWLSFLDLQGYVKRMKALNQRLDRFYNNVVDYHLAAKVEDDDSPKHFVDALLQMAEDPNLEVKLTRDRVKALIQNLLVGGVDTSATTVEWAIQEVLRVPRIMAKAKEELDRVIGRERWVEEKDFTELPYIESIIMETFRLHPLTTLLPPHYAMKDCKVAGYHISKGTTVLINTWSIGRDPKSWEGPLEFLPERFMGKDVDMLGSDFSLLPFGSGRRRCPGYNVGLKMVRTTFANLVHGFELKLMEGMKAEDICMDEEYGLTSHPKLPLSILIQPTLPPHLY